MTYCNNLHERTSPIEIFFLRTQPYLTDRPDAAPEPYATCKFGPPRIVFASYAPQINPVTYAFSQQPPLDLSLVSKKNILRSSFVRYPVQLIRGNTFALPAPPPPLPPQPPSTEWKEFNFSAALHSSSLRLVYIITTQFFVLRSSFCFFSESQKRTLIHSCPPSPCRTVFHSCVRACGWRYGLVWVQTVWINRLLTFFLLHPYYIICILLAIVCTSSSCRPFLV